MQYVASRGFVAFEFFALRLLFGLHRGELVALLARFLRQAVELFDVAAQAADEIGAQAREIGQIVQITCDLVGVFAVQQQLDGVGLVAGVLLVKVMADAPNVCAAAFQPVKVPV